MPGKLFNYYQSKRKRGYTLIEIVTALAMFTIIMLAITQILGRGVSSYRETKRTQANLETAQFALSLIAKELRTSSIVDSTITATTSTLKFYDYSQSRCIQYILNEDSGQITRQAVSFSDPDPNVNRTSCAGHTFVGGAQIVFSGLLDQAVNVVTSVPPSPDPSVGRVTFAITVGTGSNATTLQTSISLRDYHYTGL